jgi:hypothetical protein
MMSISKRPASIVIEKIILKTLRKIIAQILIMMNGLIMSQRN